MNVWIPGLFMEFDMNAIFATTKQLYSKQMKRKKEMHFAHMSVSVSVCACTLY